LEPSTYLPQRPADTRSPRQAGHLTPEQAANRARARRLLDELTETLRLAEYDAALNAQRGRRGLPVTRAMRRGVLTVLPGNAR
jgi:hypothetical protein